MVTQHLETTLHTPVWSQTDAEVSPNEQKRRLSVFRISVLQELEEDCTRVVNFCEEWHDAELYTKFAPTWEDFCRDILAIDAAWVEKLCTGLRLLRSEGYQGPVPASLAEQAAATGALRDTPGNPTGTNQYTTEEKENRNCVYNTIPYRKQSRGSTNRAYLLARLKRDHPAIFAAVERGEFRSVRAACKAAGLVQEETPLSALRRIWRKVNPDDRLRFLREMLTPDERRALRHGLEDTEDAHAHPRPTE
jgi:hypothetical protein